MNIGDMSVENHTLTKKIRSCRVCLVTELAHGILMDCDNEWYKLLEFCTGIKINPQEEPRMVCKKCASELENYVAFKRQCLVSDAHWRSLAGDGKSCSPEKVCHNVTNIKTETNELFIDNISHSEDTEIIFNKVKSITDESCNRNDMDNEFKIGIFSLESLPVDADIIHDNKELIDTSVVKVKKETKVETSLSLENSKNKCMKKELLQCKYCNRIYEREKWFLIHMNTCKASTIKKAYSKKKTNMLINNYWCGLCKFTSTSQNEVNLHFEEHLLRNDLKCEICDFIGFDFADSVSHRLLHSTDEYAVVPGCPVCKGDYRTKLSLQFHYRSTHLNKPGGYCPKCNRYLTHYKAWKRHMCAHMEKKYICDICDARFLLKNKLQTHIILHMNITTHICHLCGKGFKRESDLSLHFSTRHDNQPAKCTVCNKIYKNEQSLKAHVRRHVNDDALQCDLCGKHFAQKHLLKLHMVWHSDEKPHKCDICGFRFKSKGNLTAHILVHQGVRRHECGECKKVFATSYALKRHLAVHTGIRRHKCMYCNKTFDAKGLLRKHCESNHKLDIVLG